MFAMLILALRLTAFVDQCDGATCSVMVGQSVNPITVPQSALPPCAHEGTLLLLDGSCADTSAEPSEGPRVDDGADINL